MPTSKALKELIVAIKGAGDLASGVAWRLYQARIRKIYMLELAHPLAVRRLVSFCEAVHAGRHTVEGLCAVKIEDAGELPRVWDQGCIAVRVDPTWRTLGEQPADVVIDAILAKRNLGTHLEEAPLVIGLGPGFSAGQDVQRVIETQRGHDFGRVLPYGSATTDTGVPGNINGYTSQRVLRAPAAGLFKAHYSLGDSVDIGATIGTVNNEPILAQISGVLRGLIRDGTPLTPNMKVGDIDPRGRRRYCNTLSDKARGLGGAVLEAILERYNA
ncbi:MAG: selenium-dependent molybdenum cofactor biosynthesis protein YqeB [Desulfobacterales bacterium]